MKFNLTGYNIDNLLKTLYLKKVALFNVEKNGRNQVSFEILDKDYNKVKRHIVNFKVKKTLSSFKRFPKFLLANIWVVIGCFIGVLFGIFASQYTWQIKIFGTKNLNQSEILAVLKENGVEKGKINNKSSEYIEEVLLNKYDRIAQVSVAKVGTAIIINLSEKLVYSALEFQPITAKYCGIIKEINVVTGTINVKIGDYVNVGDVLVLPFNINADGEKINVNPLAEIKAEILITAKCEINKIEQVLTRTGKTKKVYKYKLKNLDLFYGNSKNSFALFEVNMYNENISDLIPLRREVYVYYELELQNIERNFEKEQDNLIQKSKDLAYENLPLGEIVSEKTDCSIVGDKMFALTTISVYGIIT